MIAPVETQARETSCELGGHRWDLKFKATALRSIQMTHGNLHQFAAWLMAENMGAGMSIDSQAFLIWAGQRTAEPKLKLGWVKKFLSEAHPQVRTLLMSWAAADFCTAVLMMAEAEIAAAYPEPADDGEGGEP